MASTYSTNLKIELQATGENSGTWGTITNTNLGTALEQAIVGYGNPNYTSDANLTLTYTDTNAAQAARALVLNVTSTGSLSATRELVVPTIQKQYIVQNNTSGSQSITVKTSGGTGITVPNGRKAHLYVDGTNVIQMFDFVDINGGAIDGTAIGASSASTGAFTSLTATSAAVTGASGILTSVAATQDAVELVGRAGGTSSYKVTLTPTTLSASRTLTLPDVSGTAAVLGSAQTFTAAQTFRASSAVRSEAASTQDAVVLAGRAGGTSSYAVTLTPTTLSANRTMTLPDAATTVPVFSQVITFSGPTAARTVTLPDENFTVGFRNIPAVGTKTGSYTLAVGDVGKYVQVGSGGSITIPDATFAEGDVISIFNNTTGNVTLTCSITTAYIAGTDTDKATMTLATRGVATVLFISSTVCVVSGNVS
jgi:hypothetical protein